MNFKKYGVSKNVMPSAVAATKELNGITVTCDGKGTYTISGTASEYTYIVFDIPEFTTPISIGRGGNGTLSLFNTSDSNKIQIAFYYNSTRVDDWVCTPLNRTNTVYSTIGNKTINKITVNISGGASVQGTVSPMFTNDGQLPAEFEPHMIWHDIPHYIHNTSTDTITTLPADIYADGNNATVGISGNTVQSGTPTPDNPIMPQGTGDLETSGAKAGQYKIPISSASTTTPVYLGEVETTRKIKKLVLTGEETSYMAIDGSKNIFSIGGVFNQAPELLQVGGFCTHYKYNNTISSLAQNMSNGDFVLNKIADDYSFTIRDNSFSNDTNFKQYVQQQYAAGTPVTIWYVLATPTTGIVNEPLQKIGNYADEVSGISIPTIAGANTLSVDTTLQPSEVTINYKGWHPVADVHEKSRNLFDYNAYFDSVFTPYNEFFNYSSIQLVPNTTYTLSTSIAEYGTKPRNTAFIVATTNQTPTTASGGISNISPITITTENDGILRLYKRISGNGILPTKDLFDAGDWLMLNTGSTALPYEPYWK